MRKLLRIVYRLFCWVVAVAVLLGLVAAVRHVSLRAKEKRESEAAGQKREQAVPVRVAPVGRRDLREEITVTGNVEAVHKVKVISKLAGRIDELRVSECSAVKQGQVIAIIDHEELAAEVARAEAAVSVAGAEIKSADVTVTDALREKQRMEKLFKDGATNEQNVDRAQTAYDTAIARRELSEASRKQAEAALRLAKVRLGEATIVSPITGVVSEKHLDQGNLVGKDDGIVTIVDISAVKIMAEVSERHLSRLRAGETTANVAIDSLPGQSFSGTVSKIYPSLDQRTRSAHVEIRVENPARRLMPGMYARVQLLLAERKNVLAVPVSSVLSNDGTMEAFTVDLGIAKAVKVRLGIRSGSEVEVLSGLADGDKLVVEGQSNLKDGEQVDIIPPEGGK